MKEKIFLGVDIGTGSCKVVAKSSAGSIVAETQSFYQTAHPKDGYSEQDPETIKAAFIDCIQKINGELPRKPAAVGFSSCMHSLIPVGQDGRPLYPMITWEDTRSNLIAGELKRSKKGKRLYEQTGTPIHSMSVLCKIAWFKKNKPGLFAKTSRFIGIKEFLWHCMFGLYEVDHSIASATGLFNIHNRAWDQEALNFCSVAAKQLSTPVPTFHIRRNPSAEFLNRTKLSNDVIYCIGASDGCLANAAGGIDTNKKAALTIGTSGAVRVTRNKPIVDYDTMIFNYILDEKRFVCGGPINNGGNVLKWLMKQFLGIEIPAPADFDSLEAQLALIPAGSEGLICVPWLAGERAPVWNELATGIWIGVRYHHTKYHLIRAALEGVCFTLRRILERIEVAAGKISEVYISGGFIHSNEWVQALADVLQKKLIIKTSADASAVGAAMWAEKATGCEQVTLLTKQEVMVLPNKKIAGIMNSHYRLFCDIYHKNPKMMR